MVCVCVRGRVTCYKDGCDGVNACACVRAYVRVQVAYWMALRYRPHESAVWNAASRGRHGFFGRSS